MQRCHVCTGELITRFDKVADPQSGETFSIAACGTCRLGATVPQPDDLAPYYSEYYGERHGFTAAYCSRRRYSWLRDDGERRRLLDVGCGDGAFLRFASERGWHGAGTERMTGSASDLEIYRALTDVRERFGAASFDAVTMWHTLEHFRDPRETLMQAFDLLADDGQLHVAVPSARGWQARVFGRYWLHLDVPRHLFHFSGSSLVEILTQCGFAVGKQRHQEFEYDLLGWSQSALNSIFKVPNVFFRSLAEQKTDVGAGIRAANFVLGVIFSAIALPLVLLGTLSKNGGTIVITASKTRRNG